VHLPVQTDLLCCFLTIFTALASFCRMYPRMLIIDSSGNTWRTSAANHNNLGTEQCTSDWAN